jgi:hypothetical protein
MILEGTFRAVLNMLKILYLIFHDYILTQAVFSILFLIWCS